VIVDCDDVDELEAAADAYDALVRGDFYERHEKALEDLREKK